MEQIWEHRRSIADDCFRAPHIVRSAIVINLSCEVR